MSSAPTAAPPQPRSLRLLHTAVVLQALLLVGRAGAERGEPSVGNASLPQGVASQPSNDSGYEPLSGGRLSANINQLENQNAELSKELDQLYKQLLDLRMVKERLQDKLRNETAVLKSLTTQKEETEGKIDKAEGQMVKISAQYESQVHAAEAALACLSGTCNPEQLKIWDTWACKGVQSKDDLTTITTTVAEGFRDVKPHMAVGDDGELAPAQADANATPSPAFATDVGDDFGVGGEGPNSTVASAAKAGKDGRAVNVFVGSKKVMEVDSKDVKVDETNGTVNVRVSTEAVGENADKKDVTGVVREKEEDTKAKPDLTGKWKHLVKGKETFEQIVGNKVVFSNGKHDQATFAWTTGDEIALKLGNSSYTGMVRVEGNGTRIFWTDASDPVWTKVEA